MSDVDKNNDASYRISDPEAFARNMVRLLEEGGKVMSAYSSGREANPKQTSMADEIGNVVKTLGAIAEDWIKDPKRAVEAQADLWQGYMNLWSGSMRRMLGEKADPSVEPARGDKRFADPDWSQNQFFDFVKQAYLLSANWAEHLVEHAESVDEHTRHKAEFYVRQIANALAPSNFVLTNPELLRETLASNGENLVRGMQMLAEDIATGNGELRIRQTDMTAFEVGKNLALTPGKVVFQNDLMQLLQYEAATEQVLKRPLLIVPPWINKFYILDLTPEKSFIKWATEQGHTVFVVSWVNPDARLALKSFEDYMREGIIEAVDVVEKISREDRVNAIGYCVGGTLLATTLAYMAKNKDARIASATFFTTQVDFTYAGDLKVFVDEEQIAAVEQRMQETGYLEGKRMAAAFNLLRSNDLIWPYVVNNYLKGKAPFPFDLLFWNADSTRMPAANHSFYLRECYLNNALTRGVMKIAGKKLSLGRIKIPIYNLAAKEDHIAPAKSVFVGSKFFGGPVRYVMSGSGHIAGVINPPAKKKYQYWSDGPVEGEFEDWVGAAVERPGSWWGDWQSWIESQNDEKVPARKIGSKKFKAIETAPGSYVRTRD